MKRMLLIFASAALMLAGGTTFAMADTGNGHTNMRSIFERTYCLAEKAASDNIQTIRTRTCSRTYGETGNKSDTAGNNTCRGSGTGVCDGSGSQCSGNGNGVCDGTGTGNGYGSGRGL